MQNTSIDFLLSEIKDIQPKLKNLLLFESHIGKKIIDLITFKPKKAVISKVIDTLENIENYNSVIIKVKIIKHFQNYYNKRMPYKISVLFKGQEISLIFFSRFTGYLKKVYPINNYVYIKGKIEFYKNSYQVTHPEIINSDSLLNKKNLYQVIYKQKKNLKSKLINSEILKICSIFPELNEWNKNIFKTYKNLPSFKESILNIHSPETEETILDSSSYISRLAYDEIFAYQLSLAILRDNLDKLNSNKFKTNHKSIISNIEKTLPFQLTRDQHYCTREIIEDIKSDKRTMRLLHGDVGSGKTVIAMISAYYVIKSGYQVALLAPTELLSKQHFYFFSKIFEKHNINCNLLLASTKNKKDIKKNLLTGKIELIIGTHALLQHTVKFKNLSFVIIDEQHRFGVDQRLKIREKGKKVDMLLLTATPIPRTMMLTILGDISVSTIKNKPFKTKTKTILKNEKNIKQVILFLKNRISEGQKVFWVCPKIEDENKENSSNITERYNYLNNTFTEIAALHGKMKTENKLNILESFRQSKINLLISTVVIEVGIDVPDANIIVIDHAERFGLAQIHQLRGRVGRGEQQGTCILLYKDNLSEIAFERLSIMKNSQDGFEIAEKDLQLRGGGEVMGTKQYGAEEFKFFNFQNHLTLANLAVNEANDVVSTDPKLTSNRGKELKNLLKIFKKNAASNLIAAG